MMTADFNKVDALVGILVGLVLFVTAAHAVDCYTCSVDFRQQPFVQNHPCLFPTKENERTRCSDVSRYCQGVITRINGVFVMLQRTCETECNEACTEKGFGIETSECKFCCKEQADCGMQGYKASSSTLLVKRTLLILLLLVAVLCQ